MRKINIGNWGMLLGCVGVLGLGTCSGHAYHEGILWHHWLGKDGKGRAIPDAYKALAEWQKRYEEREKNGTLSDEDKGKKLKFLWEAGGVVENIGGDSRKIFARGAFRVPRSGKYRKEFKLLSSSCLVVGSFYDGEFDAFPVTKDVKNAVKRALRVVTSEAFLSRILGADFFDEFVRRGSLPGECGLPASACTRQLG